MISSRRRVVLVCLLGGAFSVGCASGPRAASSRDACARHDADVAAWKKTLIAHPQAPPTSDPERSPPAIRTFVESAAACLSGQGIRPTRSGLALTIPPGASALGRVAAEVKDAVGGATVYDGEFFLTRPYAAASYDWQRNILFLPHAALVDPGHSLALIHERVHVRSDGTRRHGGPQARHWMVRHADTSPNALELDEVFAYAEASHSAGGDEVARRSSAEAAKQYASWWRAALARPDARFQLRGGADCAPLPPAALARIREVLDCADACLEKADCDIDTCDQRGLSFEETCK